MNILSFDTSSDRLSAALFNGSKKIATHELEGAARHSDELAAVLQNLLSLHKTRIKKIDCIAVGLGPGSFTGLRIALTTAKVLAYALGAKLVGVSSLEAVARAEGREGDTAVILDARRSQIYGAVYRKKNGHWKVIQKPFLTDREYFLRSLGEDAKILDEVKPDAAAIAETALERIEQKKFDDPFLLEPMYLRPKDCNATKPAKK